MDSIPNTNRQEDAMRVQLMAQYGAPAFLQRAHRMKNAFDFLVRTCRGKRDEELMMVRIRLGFLHGMTAGDWKVLLPFLTDETQTEVLAKLHAELDPKLEVQVTPTTSARKLRSALGDLCRALEAFNEVWRRHLAGLDLSEINYLREGYNRWYVFEKECALRSPEIARRGFVPMPPATVEEVAEQVPELAVPRLKE
jgi:hypothetical protein